RQCLRTAARGEPIGARQTRLAVPDASHALPLHRQARRPHEGRARNVCGVEAEEVSRSGGTDLSARGGRAGARGSGSASHDRLHRSHSVVFALLLLALPALAGALIPADAELEAAGARIGHIAYVIEDVFDTDNPGEMGAFYRLANHLHMETRFPAIQAQLLF